MVILKKISGRSIVIAKIAVVTASLLQFLFVLIRSSWHFDGQYWDRWIIGTALELSVIVVACDMAFPRSVRARSMITSAWFVPVIVLGIAKSLWVLSRDAQSMYTYAVSIQAQIHYGLHPLPDGLAIIILLIFNLLSGAPLMCATPAFLWAYRAWIQTRQVASTDHIGLPLAARVTKPLKWICLLLTIQAGMSVALLVSYIVNTVHILQFAHEPLYHRIFNSIGSLLVTHILSITTNSLTAILAWRLFATILRQQPAVNKAHSLSSCVEPSGDMLCDTGKTNGERLWTFPRCCGVLGSA